MYAQADSLKSVKLCEEKRVKLEAGCLSEKLLKWAA